MKSSKNKSSVKEDLEDVKMNPTLFNPSLFLPSFKTQQQQRDEESAGNDMDEFNLHRGELSVSEKYRYDLSRAQLKATSNTSALLAGFAMVALVELHYDENMPRYLLIILGIVTTLLVSFHLIALMISTCLLPYIDANGCTKDSPHNRLKFYIEL
uniref:Uncharacterized protein n=1 Tax=Panagrolaimus sp. ES5 TaxID=591445 RepID=A0AC34FWN7_9BILA